MGHGIVGHFLVQIGCKLTVELDASIANVIFLLKLGESFLLMLIFTNFSVAYDNQTFLTRDLIILPCTSMYRKKYIAIHQNVVQHMANGCNKQNILSFQIGQNFYIQFIVPNIFINSL